MIQKSILGNEMLLDENDAGLSQDLINNGIREPHTTQAYRDELEKLDDDATIIDIGANIGYYALQPCEILDDVHVIAIEPEPHNTEILKENVKLNNYEDKVTIIEAGVGPDHEEYELHLFEESNLHTINKKKGGNRETVTINVKPLPAILNNLNISLDAVDVLRMDIEGFGGQALRGMEPIFNAVSSLLCNIEFHSILMDESDNQFIQELFIPGAEYPISAAMADDQVDVDSFQQAIDYNWIELIFWWQSM